MFLFWKRKKILFFFFKICYDKYVLASMAELVDAVDSKSTSSNRVPVQVRMGAPF